jgi:two-component system, LuxR family, sensor kinase FixL
MKEHFIDRLLQRSRGTVLLWAGLSIAAIAVTDWHFEENISFEFLYLFPMLMVGGCLSRWQMGVVAALCTALGEVFDPFPWTVPLGISRLILTFAAFFGAGLYGFESVRSRRASNALLREITEEVELRRSMEEQLEFLISSSPATIFTLDVNGHVLLANAAAHRLFAVEQGSLQGQPIARFLPALATVPAPALKVPAFHTEMECRGRRQDGEMFLARVWFSTYQTRSGPRLAAIVFDTSEELRDRTEFNLRQILTGSKVLMGALCHEIRNVCGAIAVVHTKLTRDPRLAANEDFGAFGSLVRGLEKMASLELRQTARPMAESIDLRSVLDELRIVIEPSFHESEMSVGWETPDVLPRVWADREALIQVFLNITKNSQRAMEPQERKELVVRTSLEANSVVVRFIDSGHGVANPDLLFQPFQPGAEASGLGLYLSRTFLHAFRGELQYEPQPQGSCFAVLLSTASEEETEFAEES